MKLYQGTLNRDKMCPIAKRGYKSWIDQGQRCNNPNNPRYYCYGEKGVKRIYQQRELIAWYVDEYKKKPTWERPQIDRINSRGNYEFGNIRLIECSENVKYRNEEHGNPTPSMKIIAKNLATNDIIAIESIREASRLLGIDRKAIQNFLRGTIKRKPSHGFEFSFDNDT